MEEPRKQFVFVVAWESGGSVSPVELFWNEDAAEAFYKSLNSKHKRITLQEIRR